MSILGLFLLLCLASVVGLLLAVAFARAVLYAGVLAELDARWNAPPACARELELPPTHLPCPRARGPRSAARGRALAV